MRTQADRALDRVRDLCFAFAGVEEKLSHGAPIFHVRGKMFVSFSDDHHGDGRLAVWVKAEPEAQRRLVAEAPERFFVPPYVGVKGWIGVHLNREDTDWEQLAILIEEGWAAVVPKTLATAKPGPKPKRPPPRPRTDPEVARAALARLTRFCASLAGSVAELDTYNGTFRVAKKPYAYFVDSHHGDGKVAVWLRAVGQSPAAIEAADRERFFVPPYMGPKGWIAARLDVGKVDWEDVEARVAASHAEAAKKKR